MATEKRLIDADAEIKTIKENICKNCNSHNGVMCRACLVDSMIGFINEAPTVDAVEVVRCKDCKHYLWHDWDYSYCCIKLGRFVKPDFGCLYGERKDNEKQT